MVYGSYALLEGTPPEIYAFTRTLDNDRLLVVLNFSAATPVFTLPDGISPSGAKLVIANYPVGADETIDLFALRPWEARVYRVG